MSFYSVDFPDYPEFDYEMLLQYDAVVNQCVNVPGYRMSLVKYWVMDKNKIQFDELHREAQEESLVYKDPYIFPCYFKNTEDEFTLGKFGMEHLKATCILKPTLSVLALLDLVSQDKPGDPIKLSISPGDRFQMTSFNWVFEVLFVRPNIFYLNSYIPTVFDVFANLARDVSVELPDTPPRTLPASIEYKENQVVIPNPT